MRLKVAIMLVLEESHSIRQAADIHGISRSVLHRHVKEAKLKGLENIHNFQPNLSNRKVFTEEQEKMLCDYLLTAAKHHHGLTPVTARKFAYEYAEKVNADFPHSWRNTKCAGLDWLYGFRKRFPQISIRTPEATSLSRLTSFNKTNIQEFFRNLEQLLVNNKFEAQHIYNVDETGLTTAHKPPKILADKKSKQVGQLTSAERGTLVTFVGCINALGNAIPPFMIFPRVHFKPTMINGAPSGTSGAAQPTGWMTGEVFIDWLKHFKKHTSCNPANSVLLLMDNHVSHITVESVTFAKENGISLLTFPPHCSHKLQPLDRSIYGPLKRQYNTACNNWMVNHPGRTISIHDIGGLVGQAYPKAFTCENITSGFKVAGIWPFNPDIFTDNDFMGSYVTDKDNPNQRDQLDIDPSKGTSSQVIATPTQPAATVAHPNCPTPEEVRPYPKAPLRKGNKAVGRQGRSMVLTDTPVKEQLIARLTAKTARNASKQKKKMKRVLTPEESSEDDEAEAENLLATALESDSDDYAEENCDVNAISIGSFVVVKYSSSKFVAYHVGQIQNIEDDSVKINFLRRCGDSFVWPDVKDEDVVLQDSIETILPNPTSVGGTARVCMKLQFAADVSNVN
ncbi:uncharacterized protein [Watersipora subatra]|uniref:uncharacterized protein n=1 Tax=Watersipora subatra TaxID=2589382 RepID=UPI00355B2E64